MGPALSYKRVLSHEAAGETKNRKFMKEREIYFELRPLSWRRVNNDHLAPDDLGPRAMPSHQLTPERN
jgi:hypothetical protein